MEFSNPGTFRKGGCLRKKICPIILRSYFFLSRVSFEVMRVIMMMIEMMAMGKMAMMMMMMSIVMTTMMMLIRMMIYIL